MNAVALMLLADATEHGTQDVMQGLASHNYVLAGLGAIAVGVPVVLKVMGKSVPILDPILEALLSLAEKAPNLTPDKTIDPAKRDAELKDIAEKAADAEKPVAQVVPIDPGKKP